MSDEICFLSAVDLAARIRARDVSAAEVLEAHLEQIERVNPRVNAIVTLVGDGARAAAKAADARMARGEQVGRLHGVPVAHKDLLPTKGIRTTFGSRIFHDFVPEEDALLVQRLRSAGAITIGKTNTPEFGAGSQTFNEIFGATRNPYELSLTCGGSSGGAAVALACGMVPLADGSDLGGSLRNPANFCNVVGFRPSEGRVPVHPAANGWGLLSVQGPMARTARDSALMLSAIAGPDARVPISLEVAGAAFDVALDHDFRGTRVAWCMRPGGVPVDRRVLATLEAARVVLLGLGCEVEEAGPDLAEADGVFKTLRAWGSHAARGRHVEEHPDLVKRTIREEVAYGGTLKGADVAAAMEGRTRVFLRMQAFMERFEFVAMPVSQVPPFPVTQEYPTEVEGVAMESYIDWMKSCYLVSVTGHPAISVPCGFTGEGLPVGIQLVGRYRDDLGVLQLGHAFEQATGVGGRRPEL